MSVELKEAPSTESETEAVSVPNTIPTPEEIAAQARISPKLFAGHRQGKSYCEVRLVEDGIAYRPYGSPEDTEWLWARESDFTAEFVVWEEIKAGRLLRMQERATTAELMHQIAVGSMTKRSYRRYRKTVRQIAKTDGRLRSALTAPARDNQEQGADRNQD